MYFHLEPLATFIASATAIFLIFTIKFRWFRSDKYLPPSFKVIVEELSYGYCAVCLDEVSDGDKCQELPKCGHTFHAMCVDAWLECKWTCPICRRQVTDDIPNTQGQNTLFSFVISRCQDFIAKIDTCAQEFMTVLFDSGVFGHI